ncbi:MAG TPA: TolC family protein [bacterium]|nr:TolC family protein [bacterium]
MKINMLILLALLPAVISCSVERKVEPQTKIPESFSISGSEVVPDKWWVSFNDSDLNEVVNAALSGNFSLRMYADRVNQAKAVAKLNGAELYPSVSAGIGFGENLTNGSRQSSEYNSESYSASLSISYEIDLWGRLKALKDASVYNVSASLEDYEAAAISLSAQTADIWVQLIEKEKSINLLGEQARTNQEYLDLIEISFRNGSASTSDVLQQQQLLLSVKNEIKQAEAQAAVLKNLLSVLTGQAPQGSVFEIPDKLPDLPEFPYTGIPSEMLQRRPDVKSAFFSVKSADRNLAAKMAERYPKLALNTNGGLSSTEINSFFTTWFLNLAANLTTPLFDGGKTKAQIEQNKAVVQEKLNNYSNVVLTALQETENAAIREKKQSEYLEKLKEQLEIAKKVSELTRSQFVTGGTTYFYVLEALKNQQALERSVLTSERELIQYRIALYKSIAGSFDNGGIDK